MARDIESLVLTMSADISRLSKQLDRAQGKFDSTANAIERRQRQLDRNLANLGREAANFARPVQLAATVALGAITAMSYNAAKRAEAVSGAFEQTFRDMPNEAFAAVTAISEQFGRLETDIKDNFTQLRSVVSALGVDATTSLSIVDQLQRRSLDMAAFKDVSDAEAFRAVISGITGETEPLKRFGVVLNETAVKAELLRLGFKGKATEASEAAKVIARTNIILRQTGEMSGQVAREADTLAEKEKRVRAEFTKAAEDFGQQFLPVAAKVLDWATGALKAFNDLPSGVQAAGIAMLALVAAGGPIMSVIKGLQAVIKAAIAARAAMLALGGSAGAGAAGKGFLAGGAAGVLSGVLPTAAAGAGIVVGTAGFAPAPERNVELAQQNVQFSRDNLERLRSNGASANRIRSAEQRLARDLGELSKRQKEADQHFADAENEVTNAINSALSGAGDFGLTPDLLAGNGGSGGGGRGAGRAEAAAAQRQAELRDQLGLQLAIDIARANGDDAAVKAAERRQELARLTAQYEDAGYANAASRAQEHLTYLNTAEDAAEAREKAEREVDIILEGRRRQLEREADYQRTIEDQLFDRLAMEAELARLTGHEGRMRTAERELWLAERVNELLRLRLALTKEEALIRAQGEWDQLDSADRQGAMRDEFRRSFSEGVRAAIDGELGGFFENLADRFTDRMLENLADNLFDIFSDAMKGMSGGGSGFMGSLMKLIPGFSEGGYTGPGGIHEPKGVVHGGEVVWSQKDVARAGGVAVVEAMRKGMRGYAAGGVVMPSVIPRLNASMARVSAGARQPVIIEQHLHNNFEGAVMTDELLASMDAKANAARLGAVAQVASVSMQQQRKGQFRTRGR